MIRLGWTLLHFLWQGTVIAAVLAAVRIVVGRSISAQARYAMACVALGAMTVAPLFTYLAQSPAVADPIAPLTWTIPAAVQEIDSGECLAEGSTLVGDRMGRGRDRFFGPLDRWLEAGVALAPRLGAAGSRRMGAEIPETPPLYGRNAAGAAAGVGIG